MAGDATTLSRVRRRRRRPPTEAERLALGVMLGAAFGIAMWLAIASLVREAWIVPITIFIIGVNVVLAARYWPTARNYILHGYRDD